MHSLVGFDTCSANVEIARVRATFEKEAAALRIKFSRAELHAASLEKTIASKTQENAELTKICDDLLMQVCGFYMDFVEGFFVIDLLGFVGCCRLRVGLREIALMSAYLQQIQKEKTAFSFKS
jgi:hypothetical protein